MIQVDQLSKRYSGHTAIDSVSFEVGRGEIVGFLGPNGAGKTTALSLLSGAIKADHGEVEINGEALLHLRPIELARQRAVVAQSSPLSSPFHVHEVVEMGRTP